MDLKISVCVVSYNHEKYIRECLSSLVTQETKFPFEVIVGDDGSTDGTRAIIQEFASNYPNIVKPIYHVTNIGPTKNYLAVHAAAKGEYIAHVDGDDYALPGKLVALVEAMDSNPEVNMAWHRLRILDNNTGELCDDLIDVKKQPAGGFLKSDLLACGSVGGHSASVYRSSTSSKIDLLDSEMMDFYFSVERLGSGRGLWIDGFYGVYRRNVGLMMADRMKPRLFFKAHLLHFLKKYPNYRRSINSLAILLLLADIKNGRRLVFFELWRKSFHLLSIFEFIKRIALYRILRLPN